MGLNVVMMGPPGAGKGTQANRFAKERGLPKISTGDILREGIRDRNPVALEAKARMDQGELVDDATMIAIVRDRLSRPDTKAGSCWTGFRGRSARPQALDAVVEARGNGPLVIVDVAVPEAELVRRLATRRICCVVRRRRRIRRCRPTGLRRPAAASWCSGSTTAREW